jgi:AcrR family transcriptional regulator
MSRIVRPNAAGEATRHRILEVAWQLIVDHGVSVSMNEIADAAGVTRQTVHFHFGSRANLLIATARYRDQVEHIGDQFAAGWGAPTAAAALEATIRTWFAYVPRILPVARALHNAAASDDDAAQAWWDRMDAIHRTIRHVVQRLAHSGDLAPTWTVDEATDIVWAITHPRVWDDLVEHRGWTPVNFIDRQVEVAQRILLPGTSEQRGHV